MLNHDLNIIYKINNTNLFKIQSQEIINMGIDSVLINDESTIDTNLNIYENIEFNNDLSKIIYEYFSNKSKLSTTEFTDFIYKNLDNINDIYLDFSSFDFDNNVKLFKAIFIFSISLFSHICFSDELYNKLNTDNDLHYFIKDLIIFRKYMDSFNKNNIKLLISKDNIIVYNIHNVYYLFNVNSNPVKFELPINMQNKTYFSVLCNNDKHLRDILVIGKNHFFIFEEIE